MGNLKKLTIALPATDRRSALDEKLKELEALIVQAVSENAVLTEFRDTLLPKLMSGQVLIRDAEKVVEDAV